MATSIRGSIPALVLGLLLAGCGSTEEVSLDYAKDVCAACGMRVTAPRYASLNLTPEGERRPYDAIECAIRDLRVNDPTLRGRVFLPDFAEPGVLRPWDDMTVVRADFPSPMGGGYAAFLDGERATLEAERRDGTSGTLFEFVEGVAP